jgi:hypothetical protein
MVLDKLMNTGCYRIIGAARRGLDKGAPSAEAATLNCLIRPRPVEQIDRLAALRGLD